MTWRDDIRGVRRVDLACAALLVPVSIWAGSVILSQDAGETQVQETQVQETQVQDAGETYADTWEWCLQRFENRTDLQEACQWGAFEMLPGPQYATEEGILINASESKP